jgi:hypothetical protein
MATPYIDTGLRAGHLLGHGIGIADQRHTSTMPFT